MTPLLDIQDLKIWFPAEKNFFGRPAAHVRAVDGVSLWVGPGETVGLVGESGCGKSTLARGILKLDVPHAGRIVFDGQDILQLTGKPLQHLRRELQVVFQDPFSSLNPRMQVLDIVTEGMVYHGLINRREQADNATRLLDDVGLGPHALYRYPHEFSGGQRQRICIARALSMRPRMILCDEAVSALDVSVQAQVINLLMDLRDQYQLSYLFISHDLSVVRHIAHRIAVMYLGRLVETGDARDVIDGPMHPYTQALISAVPRMDGAKRSRIVLKGDVPSPIRPPTGCRFHPRCPRATEECARIDPRLLPARDDPRRAVACIHVPAQDDTPGTGLKRQEPAEAGKG